MCTTSTLLHSAGVLIIWDRIFGTFKAEDKQIRSYGLAKPLETFNPIIANFEHFIRISYSPLLLFKRRVRHGNVFQIFHLFDTTSYVSSSVSLWDIHERVTNEGSGDLNVNNKEKHFMVPIYKGAPFPFLSLMSLHVFIHWAITFATSFMLVSKLSSFSTESF